MAEYLVQDTSLTSVADKIRVLSGTTGTMGLDNMKTHIDDANTEVSTQSSLLGQIITTLENKAAGSDLTPIVNALTDKGIEVPDGTKVDGLASLIAAIESGGGGMKVVSGSYVSNINVSTNAGNGYISISHELGVIPDLIIFRPTTTYMEGNSYIGWIIAVKPGGKFHFTENLSTMYKTSGKETSTYIATIYEYTSDFVSSSGYICRVTDTSFSVEYNGASYLKVGEEYVFFAVGG